MTSTATLDPRLLKDIGDAEGCKLQAYKDSRGLWTVGFGHLLDQHLSWDGYTISQDEANALLKIDVTKWRKFAESLREWPYLLTDCRCNAVTELCFNMGERWLEFVKTRRALEIHDWQGAHDGLLASEWALQVHKWRSDRLADYLLTGEYPARNP